MDYEIGHINMSVPGKKIQYDKNVMVTEEDEEAIVGWHRDSYPFVCVLMMSDTTGMIGGETALRTGNGEIKKVRGPQKVSTQATMYMVPSYTLLGLCGCPPGSLHRSPSPSGLRRSRAHYYGNLVPTALAPCSGRHRSEHSSSNLKPFRLVRAGC
jgi:hypothetical protein